jgi:hypothetical protein
MRDLNQHGNDGSEVVGILPQAQRDEEGIFWTTASRLLLKRLLGGGRRSGYRSLSTDS